MVLSCRTHRPANGTQPLGAGSSEAFGDSATHNYDSILDRLLTLENAVRATPRQKNTAVLLYSSALDTVSGCFLVAGKGVAQRDAPEGTWESARKTAARRDALRWALYCKAWQSGILVPFGSTIVGDIMYSKVLFERQDGDTLCILLQAPIGSIVVK